MTALPDRSPRTLTVCSESGLANRLRVLLSAMALSEATGRALQVHWPRTPACAGRFDELFEPSLPVHDGDAVACAALPLWGGVGQPMSDLLHASEQHLALRSPDWLIRPDQYPAHAPLCRRCMALWPTHKPAPYERETVAAFQRQHFRSRMIGVHLRRGDFLRARPDVVGGTPQALAAVERLLAGCPEAGLFVCTDDGARDPVTGRVQAEGVVDRFRERFGERVVSTTPRSLDRASSAAIQDALVDLYLLRQTDFFVGTRDSSFSAMAVFGRDVQPVLVGTAGAYPWLAALGTVTGVFPLVQLVGRWQFRRRVPVMILLSYYSGLARRLLARLPGRARPR